MQRLGYVPALDGVRGIAIAAVVLCHFFGLPGGFFGVDLFFVLSGFLITTLLLEDGRLGRFYERRARRLLPALLALLLVVGLPLGWPRLAEGGLYTANFFRAFAHPDPLRATSLDHLWSLAAEEQFYLVWPVLLLVMLRWRRLVTVALSVMFVALVAYRIGVVLRGTSLRRVYYGPDTHADGLVLGSLMALVRPRVSAAAGRAGLGVLIALFALGALTVGWLAYGLPAFEIAAALVVLAAADRRLPELTLKPLVWLGLISYSLYLWHQPVHLAFPNHASLALPLAVGLSLASYVLIEKPFRRRRTTPGDAFREPLEVSPQPAVVSASRAP